MYYFDLEEFRVRRFAEIQEETDDSVIYIERL